MTVYEQEGVVHIVNVHVSTDDLKGRVDSASAGKNRSRIVDLLENAVMAEVAMPAARRETEQANDIAQPIDVVCSIEARARKIDGFEFVSHLGGDPEHPGQQDSNQQEYAFHKLSLLWLVVIVPYSTIELPGQGSRPAPCR